MSKIVVALGGNALQRDGEASAIEQELVAKETVKKLIPLIMAGHQIVIVHGKIKPFGKTLFILLIQTGTNSQSRFSLAR